MVKDTAVCVGLKKDVDFHGFDLKVCMVVLSFSWLFRSFIRSLPSPVPPVLPNVLDKASPVFAMSRPFSIQAPCRWLRVEGAENF